MKYLSLPQTALTVSTLCLGTADWGTVTGETDAERLLALFLEAGGNFLDTAHCYAFWKPQGIGASETMVGKTVGKLLGQTGKHRLIVATKGGHPPDPAFPAYTRPGPYLSPETIRSDIAESIGRLDLAPLDLYYLHRDDGVTPAGEIIELLNSEIQAGHLRYLGASNWRVERIAEANAYAARHGLQGFVASQIQWSLATPGWTATDSEPTVRSVTEKEQTWHRETGIPLVAYSATAGGYFAGNPGADPLYASAANATRKKRAETLAAELGCTPQQVALAYLLCQPISTVALFSTSRREHLAEILGSSDISLTPPQLAYLSWR